jgi:distribution and morphology protein 34
MAQSPSVPRTGTASGNSWSTGQPSRSNTMSTLASSQLPSSKSMSIQSKSGQGRQQQQHQHQRNVSMSGTSPGRSFPPRNVGLGGITLPLNNSVSQLATLSHSNHTLSPYARGHEHIAVRSFPHLGKSTPSIGGQSRSSSGEGLITSKAQAPGNIKAKRKRLYRLGMTKNTSGSSTPLSPDLDDTPPPRYEQTTTATTATTPEDEFRRLSFGSMDKTWDRERAQPSLTGLAQRVMRPNMARSPASRTSYGFPDTH